MSNRFQRSSDESPIQWRHSNSSKPSTTLYSKLDSDSSLINTSLPAKNTPSLPAATLASLTSNSTSTFSERFSQKLQLQENTSTYTPLSKISSKKISIESQQDFPSLGGSSSKSTTTTSNKPSYASLSQKWAEQSKEEKENQIKKQKEDTEKLRLQKEKEQSDRLFATTRFFHASQLYSNKNNDDYKYNIGGDKNEELDNLDDDYQSPTDEYDEESDEDNEEELDDPWNRRRNKNDLY